MWHNNYCLIKNVDESILAERCSQWKPPRDDIPGLLGKYRRSVKSAHYGAITW